MAIDSRAVKQQMLLELPPKLAQPLNELAEKGATKAGVVRYALEIYLGQLSPEVNNRFVVELSDGTAELLSIFRDLTHLPDRNRLVEAALREYLQTQIASNPQLQRDFEKEQQVRTKRVRSLKEARKE